ncbi:unnamed protein product [Zymoseptoria tritici ST99CH_3D7]|uniref:LysM domain-containing protein n=2 Tax=Zymoseptoria tritici TaxID=1047171 RepID=A0A1X7RG25_ZYMT9|nr:unnamed protein product [Zymoseptoria tritici ST99CH_3D7]SMR42529.1 unnamed protein product [Zymoseptoria tritici ST99CH_1E4]
MLFLQLIPFLLLAGPVSARPRLLEHQSSNDVISGMTPTSADRPQTAACTPATLACTAEYVALHGRNCGEIASVHAIQFSDHEVELSSDSKQCERILREYGLCPVHTRTTATPPAFPTFPTNEAQAVLMISPAVAVLIPQDLDLAQSMMWHLAVPEDHCLQAKSSVLLSGHQGVESPTSRFCGTRTSMIISRGAASQTYQTNRKKSFQEMSETGSASPDSELVHADLYDADETFPPLGYRSQTAGIRFGGS